MICGDWCSSYVAGEHVSLEAQAVRGRGVLNRYPDSSSREDSSGFDSLTPLFMEAKTREIIVKSRKGNRKPSHQREKFIRTRNSELSLCQYPLYGDVAQSVQSIGFQTRESLVKIQSYPLHV